MLADALEAFITQRFRASADPKCCDGPLPIINRRSALRYRGRGCKCHIELSPASCTIFPTSCPTIVPSLAFASHALLLSYLLLCAVGFTALTQHERRQEKSERGLRLGSTSICRRGSRDLGAYGW